ncbi:hypothetical protein O181_007797 [Austropuccinia psidii MF-1]|uniref:Reverse transcriptase Ty1/copia-type domain-containing protein n=1 Tax=Austropuccinia psidii MF-1 TaxID=1389203 RepID=A0A9Q3BMN6_9BASI|nr:hypothetical protein [Austropuccinia psidii MF-1]
MLTASNLPITLWPWEFQHAMRIFNQNLHTDDDKTPFELLGNKKPFLKMLQVFGATSFIHNHNFKKDLSVREVIGYHLVIAEDPKGWLFWIPGKKVIARLVSVKFDEKLFYKPGTNYIKYIQVSNLFGKSMISKTDKQEELITTISSNMNPDIIFPTMYREAIHLNNRNQWIAAINEELESMVREDVFKSIELKQALAEVPHESILRTKWVFVKKPKRYKAQATTNMGILIANENQSSELKCDVDANWGGEGDHSMHGKNLKSWQSK